MKTSHVLLLVGAALVWAGHARAGANPEAKAAYVEARDAAAATYKAARARCDAITGNPKDQCIADAKAERVRAEEEAAASYANTVKAYTRARLRIASATRPRQDTLRGADRQQQGRVRRSGQGDPGRGPGRRQT
jgi:hypothetical protein